MTLEKLIEQPCPWCGQKNDDESLWNDLQREVPRGSFLVCNHCAHVTRLGKYSRLRKATDQDWDELYERCPDMYIDVVMTSMRVALENRMRIRRERAEKHLWN